MGRQTTSKKTGYIAPPPRGHNPRRMFIKRWKNSFFPIEEERLSPVKYDGGPMFKW